MYPAHRSECQSQDLQQHRLPLQRWANKFYFYDMDYEKGSGFWRFPFPNEREIVDSYD